MELIKEVDAFLESPPPINPPRNFRGFHPSSASCVIKNEYDEDEVVGKCLRANYWSFKAVAPTNPMTARGHRITSVGSMVERWEVDRYKEMGIWRGNNVKFQDMDNNISGEVDAFVWDKSKKEIVGVEIKTGYGYQFETDIIGKTRKGKPKMDHTMQTMLYLNFFRNVPLFKLVYIDRGNAARVEFDVTLDKKTGEGLVDGKSLAIGLTVPAIIHRYKTLDGMLKDGVLPPRDYEMQYSDEKVQFLYDSKRLTAQQTKQFDKTQKANVGSWRCSYCDYKDYCWKGDKNESK